MGFSDHFEKVVVSIGVEGPQLGAEDEHAHGPLFSITMSNTVLSPSASTYLPHSEKGSRHRTWSSRGFPSDS